MYIVGSVPHVHGNNRHFRECFTVSIVDLCLG